MRKIFFLFIVFLFIQKLKAQENNQFIKSYSKAAITNAENNEFEEYVQAKNVLIFNYGDGADIKFYVANGEVKILRRITEITEGKTDSGRTYQMMKVLDENAFEILIILYSDDELRMLYLNTNTNDISTAVSLLP